MVKQLIDQTLSACVMELCTVACFRVSPNLEGSSFSPQFSPSPTRVPLLMEPRLLLAQSGAEGTHPCVLSLLAWHLVGLAGSGPHRYTMISEYPFNRHIACGLGASRRGLATNSCACAREMASPTAIQGREVS